MNFNNTNVVISGATSGLGELIARDLIDSGANLFFLSRNVNKLKKLLKRFDNSKHNYIELDLFEINEIQKKISKIKKHFKKIDFIIHAAGGGLGVKSSIPDTESYLKVFNLNLFSIFEINRELLPLLKKNNYSKIFHVGSIAANESAGSLTYNVAKSSLASYVRSLSKDLAKYKISVTGINPGSFIYKNNAMGRLKKKNNDAYKRYIYERLPSLQMPKGEELIPLIRTVLKSKSMIFTGNMISIDNGEGKFYKSF